MRENVIFCYSGTGNCLDLAKNIARALGDTDIVMMRRKSVITDVRDAKRVGFVFPCYAGGLPDGVEESMRSVQLMPYTYKFAVCSYSAFPGNGLRIAEEIFHLDYWRAVSHHCSCVWLFPHDVMLPPMTADGAQRRSERIAREIARSAKRLEHKWESPKKSPLGALEQKAWPKFSRKKAAQFSVNSLCIGCGTCVKICPRDNIILTDGRPQFGTDCIQCLSCLQYCPQEAILLGEITARREHYHNPNVTADELTQSIIHID